MTSNKLNKVIFAIFFVFSVYIIPSFAEPIIDYELGYSLNIPEGFVLSDYTEDGLSLLFEHPNIPVSLIIRAYPKADFSDSENALATSLTKLSATGNTDTFNWSNQKCAITTFEMTLDKPYAGWGVSAPITDGNYYIVCLCYANKDKADACNQFIISTLNSLCIDDNFFNTPGIIATYAYPKEGSKNLKLKIGSYTVNTSIDRCDAEAAQFIVDLEYGVLCLYANHPMMMDAWKRFYKMIYRDSCGRLSKVNEDIQKVVYSGAVKKNPSKPDQEYAATLLSWVQNFEYRRDNEKNTSSDFTALPAILEGKGNDCDSRSMLLCVLLNDIGVDSLLLFSPQFSHAMGAFNIDAPGQKYDVQTEDQQIVSYIMGETTAKVTLGTIAQDHADRSKWYFVQF